MERCDRSLEGLTKLAVCNGETWEIIPASGDYLLAAFAQGPTTTTTSPEFEVDACGCEQPYQRGGGYYRHVMCELCQTDVVATDALNVLRMSVGDRRACQ